MEASEAMEPQPDSLEGWVAVRGEPFETPGPPPKLHFLAAWNPVEGTFALTCHRRPTEEEEEEEGASRVGSWAAALSPPALRGLHRQLAALAPSLEGAFPALPPALDGSPGGLWALLFPGEPAVAEAELEGLCRRLERYLGWALELCGPRVLLETLFGPDPPTEEEEEEEDYDYFENLHEFRRKAVEARLSGAKEALRRVLQQHEDTEKLVDLMALYKEEDEAYWELVTVATEFYQYLLQPFRHMRELATLYRLEILKALKRKRLGPKRVESLQKEAEEWTDQAEEAVCSVQDITVRYFKETVTALAAMQKQMEQDQKRFGQAAWALASSRLEHLKYLLAKETLQHRRAKELCLKRKRTGIRKQMEDLNEQENDVTRVEEMELEYYENQLELYEVQFEILKNEEMLLTTQLETLRRQMKEIQEEVIYYDTCEDPGQLESSESMLEETAGPACEVSRLKQRMQQLESKRGIICSRRAYLRNKKELCEESHRRGVQQAQESSRHFQQHHSIQIKRDRKKEEEEEKKVWLNKERQKTLERLKTFKEKCPSQFMLKTSRSQPSNAKPSGGVASRTLLVSSQPSSTSKKVPSKAPKKSRQAPTKRSRALHPEPSNEVSIQIFESPRDPEQRQESEGVSNLQSPPPAPPPPPPPPPLLVNQPICLRTAKVKDQALPLVCEDPPKGDTPPEKRDQKTSFRTANNYAGSMDDVLASLKRGEILLRKVDETPRLAAPSAPCLNDNILAAIKQGVKLRKVNREPKEDAKNSPGNDLERSIKAAMQRIKKVSADSEEDENNDHNSGEWNS